MKNAKNQSTLRLLFKNLIFLTKGGSLYLTTERVETIADMCFNALVFFSESGYAIQKNVSQTLGSTYV